jgi:proton-translocating NAD(P)+ transhydrogenase subunit alpha
MNNSSGVGVLDKTVSVLSALESGPASLAQLVKATGLARPTAHRIAVALETHRMLARDTQGRFVLGPRIGELAAAAGEDRLLAIAQPVLAQLRDITGESAQLYRPHGDTRICVAAAERTSGLRDTVPVGAALPMTAGSAAQVLLAWEEGGRMHRGLRGAKFTATTLAQVRRRGWAATAAEREAGVASVSAPVRGPGGRVIGAVSVSGPIERLTRSPGRLHAAAVVAAGEKISRLLRAEAVLTVPWWSARQPTAAASSPRWSRQYPSDRWPLGPKARLDGGAWPSPGLGHDGYGQIPERRETDTTPGNGYEVVRMKAGVVKETAAGERRVALVPDAVAKLAAAGIEVLVERGAGDGAWLSDSAYADAGASIVSAAELYRDADVILTVTKPPAEVVSLLRPGQAVIGMLAPLVYPDLAAALATQGVTAISLDRMPRTLTRTQPMDALSSQANVAGYKAAVAAAAAFGRFFPLLITAAGTARPAKVLVLGAGVAGLQAIGTARRLGAVVSGYDVRPASKTEVESLGATFIELTAGVSAAGEGGYARELSADERQAQQDELVGHIARHDVVITTAQVPGRRPPLLVTEDAVKAMAAGSVVVDMGASTLGGNVSGSRPGETVVTGNGITIIGADNLPTTMPTAASNAYSRNISALLEYLTADGALAIDTSDEVQAGVVITHDGRVVNEDVARLLSAEPPSKGGVADVGRATD